ncbi:radical SAM protein [Propionispora vibrioides]|uniref:Radical SAM superfamily protein n=1 Tax=Propionispora vibrioides TaxID=112903 RepID=A0A1H8XME9_9FIRM|nr:radical SAM protein [Propionispora vibrioides]SEP40933.1 Radical SAM superfamily protein [Propionispora vibrioides]
MIAAVWGTGEFGKYIKQYFNNEKISVEYFIDQNRDALTLNGTQIILLPEKYLEELDIVLIGMLKEIPFKDVVKKLRMAGINKIGIVPAYIFMSGKEISIKDIFWLDLKKEIMPYLETNIIDSCNLKCKGCTHFSNLYTNNSIYDIELFKKDLSKLEENFNILYFRLLGGEPLLNPDLVQYIKITRTILPSTDIRIVTNGLLILQQKEDVLFHVMKQYNISFDISSYQPTRKIKHSIIKKLDAYDLRYRFSIDIETFNALLTMHGKNNPQISQEKCFNRGCRFLREGKLYKCPLDGLMYKYKEYFGIDNLPIDSGVNLYMDDFTGRINALDDAISLCKYCSEKPRIFKWDVARKPEIDDWLDC